MCACCGGGSGLSYTTFSYSQPKLNVTSLGPCDTLGLSVEVHNTGGRDGDEVVQLYTRQPEATVPVPNIRLVAFERVTIPAGKTAEVEVHPSRGFDMGNGPGKAVKRTVKGGPVGIVFDARGRNPILPEEELLRKDQLARTVAGMNLYEEAAPVGG